jgi:hypothetical protein
MNELQQQAEKAWGAIHCIERTGYCNTKHVHSNGCCDERIWENWLINNGFPASRPPVHTVAGLAQQTINGRNLPSLVLWIADHVLAIECPDCGKQILYREARKKCTGCGEIYPADRWASGQPCKCGCMDVQYAGCHTANRFGMEFWLCETPECRYSSPYTPLTIQELAGKVQDMADAQRSTGDAK